MQLTEGKYCLKEKRKVKKKKKDFWKKIHYEQKEKAKLWSVGLPVENNDIMC